MQTILETLLSEIEAAIPSSSHAMVESDDASGFSLQLGRSPAAVIIVTVEDPDTPYFSVTYPALIVSRSGHESIEERTAERILSQGVAWIARKVFRFGHVPPEGYRRDHSNAGRPHKV